MFENNHETYRKPESSGEKLNHMMEHIAQKLNSEFMALGETQPLLNSDNTINPEAFRPGEKVKGKKDRNHAEPVISSEAGVATNASVSEKPRTFVDADREKIRDRYIELSAANNPNTQLYYKDKYKFKDGGNIVDEIIEQFKKNNEEKPSFQLEKAITALFYKFLNKQFLVMRSCAYDDHFNGIDNVIVNKETGDVICAFDEVHSEVDGERLIDKTKKVIKIAKDDGATLKYGVILKKDAATGKQKLVKRPITNIPVFYIGLSHDELKGLFSGMNYDIDGKMNQVEFDIFDKLMVSLEDQIKTLSNERLSPEVRDNIRIFKESIRQMKDLRLAKEQT